MPYMFQKHQGPQTAVTFSHPSIKEAFLLKFKFRYISLYSIVSSKKLLWGSIILSSLVPKYIIIYVRKRGLVFGFTL